MSRARVRGAGTSARRGGYHPHDPRPLADLYDYEIETVADALQIPPLTSKIGTLAIGERRRVALARALLGKPDILALDEPTNHLDVRTVEEIEELLVSAGPDLPALWSVR